jgi:hypothetical protein
MKKILQLGKVERQGHPREKNSQCGDFLNNASPQTKILDRQT